MEPSKPTTDEQEPNLSGDKAQPPPEATAEPVTATVVAPESETPPIQESPATAYAEIVAEPPPAPPGPTPEELEQRQKLLQDGRTPLLAMLHANQRPKPAALTEALSAYLQSLKDSPDAHADEWSQIRAQLTEKWTNAKSEDEAKWTQVDGDGRRHLAGYVAVFEALAALEQAVVGEIERMVEDQEPFKNAPQELRDSLLNYRKGIEIIQRMIKRLRDRRKPMSADLPALPNGPTVNEAAPALEQWSETLTQACQQHFDWRNASGNTLSDARKLPDNIKKEIQQIVKNLVGALDGVENGLRSEPELLALLQPFQSEHAVLIGSWMQAYQRLDQAIQPFFATTGLKPITVVRGTPFQPETMEPGGTVTDPELKNEDVSAVLRRGYSYDGELIRPLLVEVVVNRAAPAKE